MAVTVHAGEEGARRAGGARFGTFAAACLAAFGAAAPLLWQLASGRTLAWFDAASFYAPMRSLIGEALRAGELPLWSRFVAGGMPLLGEAAHGALHPYSLFAALVLRTDGVDFLLVAHQATAAAGATVLAARLGAGVGGSVAAGLGYGLSGFILSMTAQPNALGALGAMPWVVAALQAAGERAGPWRVALASLSVALSVLAGDPQTTAAAIALGGLLAVTAAGRGGALRAGAFATLGLAMAAVQLVPLWGLVTESTRSQGLRPEDLTSMNFSAVRLLELLSPGLFIWAEEGYNGPVVRALAPESATGLTFAASVYVGVPILVAASAGLRARGAPRLGLFAAALLWLSLGPTLGAQWLLGRLPLVGSFRYGEKWVGPLTLCLALLGALGIERWRSDALAARRGRLVALGLAAIGLVALAVTCFLAAPGDSRSLAGALPAHLRAGLPHLVVGGLALAGVLTLLARGVGWGEWAVAAAVWGLAVAAAPYGLRPGSPEARLGAPAAKALVEARRPRIVHAHPFVRRGSGRGFWDDVAELQASVSSVNVNVRQGIDHLAYYSGLEPRRFAAVREALAADWPRAARRFAVTHVLVQEDASGFWARLDARATEGGRLVGTDERNDVLVYEVPHRPWASFAPATIAVADADAALEALLELNESGSNAVVVEGGGPFPVAAGRVLSTSRGRASVRVEAEAEAPATLVVNEAWWPGWRAFVDGREVPLFPADVLVRAVVLPAGRHVVEMRYVPLEVHLGVGVSVVALVALGAAVVVLRRRERRAGEAARIAG